jgi:hypothetical protein
LAQFLPVRPEKFLSHARKQLDAAFDLLSRHRIIERITWVSAKTRPCGGRVLPMSRGLGFPSASRARWRD